MPIPFAELRIILKRTGLVICQYDKGYMKMSEDRNRVFVYDEEMNIIDVYERELFTAIYYGAW